NGAGRGQKILSVVSMHVFEGRLYVGSSGWFNSLLPSSELIRINPNDSWQLVVGDARLTSDGLKRPITGLPDCFGNPITAHFSRMDDQDSALYVGTKEFSWVLQSTPFLDPFFRPQYGFDVYASGNGRTWHQVTHDGFAHGFDFGARTFASTPTGLFIGSAN